jgi:predicted methyltransferase
VIALAERAGLVFEAASEVNGNPRDTRDYEEGVWTLPPSLTLGERDREKYTAIGESDRMTLRFRKPAQ